ncbi:MAG: hypothetical protein ACLUNV_06700 [Sutterella wadsworthensis]
MLLLRDGRGQRPTCLAVCLAVAEVAAWLACALSAPPASDCAGCDGLAHVRRHGRHGGHHGHQGVEFHQILAVTISDPLLFCAALRVLARKELEDDLEFKARSPTAIACSPRTPRLK